MFDFEFRRIALVILVHILNKEPPEKREETARQLAHEAGIEPGQANDFAREIAQSLLAA